jgi:hypothetical protein
VKLLTKPIEKQLRENAKKHPKDPFPVVKFFTPDAGATWLITELAADGDTMFGLCDLGLGFPELGYVSLSELQEVRGHLGLPVERDRWFKADKPLSQYLDAMEKAY